MEVAEMLADMVADMEVDIVAGMVEGVCGINLKLQFGICPTHPNHLYHTKQK